MDKNLTFKTFLIEAVDKKKKKKIPKPKPRPKKNLWFNDKDHWHRDLQFVHGGNYRYHTTQEQEEQQQHVYATDLEGGNCYGVWQGPKNKGITFHKPRPLHTVKSPRVAIKHLPHPETGTATNIR